MVVPTIPATQKVEIRRIEVQGQPRHKVSETPSQQTRWTWWFISAILVMWEAVVEESPYKASRGKKLEILSKK
jgi:hypothetical protein